MMNSITREGKKKFHRIFDTRQGQWDRSEFIRKPWFCVWSCIAPAGSNKGCQQKIILKKIPKFLSREESFFLKKLKIFVPSKNWQNNGFSIFWVVWSNLDFSYSFANTSFFFISFLFLLLYSSCLYGNRKYQIFSWTRNSLKASEPQNSCNPRRFRENIRQTYLLDRKI